MCIGGKPLYKWSVHFNWRKKTLILIGRVPFPLKENCIKVNISHQIEANKLKSASFFLRETST